MVDFQPKELLGIIGKKGGIAVQPEIKKKPEKKPEKKRVKVRIGKGSCSICD